MSPVIVSASSSSVQRKGEFSGSVTRFPARSAGRWMRRARIPDGGGAVLAEPALGSPWRAPRFYVGRVSIGGGSWAAADGGPLRCTTTGGT